MGLSKRIFESDIDVLGFLRAETVTITNGAVVGKVWKCTNIDGSGEWADADAVSSPLTTKGDVFVYSTTNTRLGVGTDGQILSSDSAEVTGLKWIDAPTGGGASLTKSVNQTTHGFTVGNAIRHNGTIWVKAQADSLANSGTVGIVETVTDVDNFDYAFGGFLAGAYTNGVSYFLSPTTAGLIITEPSYSLGQIREFIGTGTPDGLLIELDLGDEITSVDTILTTKGDLVTYDTAAQRLGVGTDGQILSADSVEATGLKWVDNNAIQGTTSDGRICYGDAAAGSIQFKNDLHYNGTILFCGLQNSAQGGFQANGGVNFGGSVRIQTGSSSVAVETGYLIDATLTGGETILRFGGNDTNEFLRYTSDTGYLRFSQYGVGARTTGTAAYGLSVTADGTIIETAAGGGASALSELTDVTSATQTAGFVLASSGGAYEGRALIAGDIPNLNGSYVDLTTAQSIGGVKTFSATPVFSSGIRVNAQLAIDMNGEAAIQWATAQSLMLIQNGGSTNIELTSSATNFIKPLFAPNHGTASQDEVVNVCYGTSATPPTASTTTEGALYVQYTA